MQSVTNFYDNLDLKYPEIAIAMEEIDMTNPKKIKFIIPILTPYMNSDKEVTSKIRQNTSNLQNADKSIEVGNLDVSNFIYMTVPKHLCLPEIFDVKLSTMIESLKYDPSSLSYSGSVDSYTHSLTSLSLHNINGSLGPANGSTIIKDLEIVKAGTIPKGSKWIVVFIGGDITKPQIIGRYYD